MDVVGEPTNKDILGLEARIPFKATTAKQCTHIVTALKRVLQFPVPSADEPVIHDLIQSIISQGTPAREFPAWKQRPIYKEPTILCALNDLAGNPYTQANIAALCAQEQQVHDDHPDPYIQY